MRQRRSALRGDLDQRHVLEPAAVVARLEAGLLESLGEVGDRLLLARRARRAALEVVGATASGSPAVSVASEICAAAGGPAGPARSRRRRARRAARAAGKRSGFKRTQGAPGVGSGGQRRRRPIGSDATPAQAGGRYALHRAAACCLCACNQGAYMFKRHDRSSLALLLAPAARRQEARADPRPASARAQVSSISTCRPTASASSI